ncbi:MAG: hypothetical protein K1X36_12570, partial [Pyrinomonadaceae bacterium]|nr:hypothetical protein [Pyrinomonadaceae bacterium]
MYEINETHDPNLKSWVESANDPNTDFPIQNLPFCVFKRRETNEFQRIGAVIGDMVFDFQLAFDTELDESKYFEVQSFTLNELCDEFDESEPQALRRRVQRLLSENTELYVQDRIKHCLINLSDAEVISPFIIGDYTDFYCSIYHATNVGSMFRPDNPLLPNYKYVPIGYHGRASSIVISGTDVKRPHGQNRSDAEKPPVF